ncbi:thiosulfate oxidation carrier protein SoxY [Beggiatoa leptomitoformis]|uniref:Thiosulfate oxidation carrier protein SoxY n=1 Tax=Beggiatoa leptomitoformis TaxID=288004 RepID=A0A2N9YHX1_9GAMM|nr:thiosulfate oxidation carrier protein SoxY [Beggiatoa leptomitoformis]ALG67913.1 thiosulfate oxidation carrier protein SoxY [Beggiatoa leptomitoformis]AUI69816.1 thiosulfate oxidation carrier protein SoxY [Beggiatoa leptomitoformis]
MANRRTFLQGSLASGVALVGASVLPQTGMAEWSAAIKPAFAAKETTDIIKALFNQSEVVESADIEVKAPDIAENGAVVPVQVITKLPNLTSITLIAPKNPVPLVAKFSLSAGMEGFVSTRIKMGGTGDVVAIVESDGKLFSAKKEVKVTIGGCGG